MILFFYFAQDSSILLATQVLFFIFGWVFFMSKLYKDYEVKRPGVQIVFSLTFALSCTMFELVIFEILGVLDGGCAFVVAVVVVRRVNDLTQWSAAQGYCTGGWIC